MEKTVLGSNVIYAAASGVGKSIMGITTALNCFLQGQNVLLISYEISKAQIIIRMRSLLTGVSLPPGESLCFSSKEFVLS